MAKSLEELELAFQARYPKVEKQQERNKTLLEKATKKEKIRNPKIDEKTTRKTTKEETIETTRETTKEAVNQTTKEATKIKDVDKEANTNNPISISIPEIVFYILLVIVVAGAVILSREGLGKRVLGGRYLYETTSTSMQSVYPKGSLIFVENIEPDQLIVGDDIVFIGETNEFIISRITEIKDNYEGTSEKAFLTAGIDEEDSSKAALASKVIGKVTGSIPRLGAIIRWIGENLWIVVVIFVLTVQVPLYVKISRQKDKNKKQSKVVKKGAMAKKD